MPETSTHNAEARLTLRSRLAELSLVWPWVDALALKYSIPSDTRYAIDLCLEEALSNIIRHGYAGEPNHILTVDCSRDGSSWLKFIVEDSAPHFSPVETPINAPVDAPVEANDSMPVPTPSSRAATPASIEESKVGRGIYLMRHFAGSLAWEQLPYGNRLTIGFRITPPTQL